MKFSKLEGLGNDFIFTEDVPKNPTRVAKLLCDRNYGVGADGMIIIIPPDDKKVADVQIRIFNADGSETFMCGNAIRCLGKYLFDRGKIKKQNLQVQTVKNIIPTTLMVRDNKVYRVKIDMGIPIFERSLISMQYSPGEEQQQVINEKIYLDEETIEFTALSMGNPHIVTWISDVDKYPVHKFGAILENYSLFPERTNIEFIQMIDDNYIKQRTWERGVGETLACGSGAAASVVAGVILGKLKRKSKVELKGGILEIYWSEKNNHVYMTGPCKDVFDGVSNIL